MSRVIPNRNTSTVRNRRAAIALSLRCSPHACNAGPADCEVQAIAAPPDAQFECVDRLSVNGRFIPKQVSRRLTGQSAGVGPQRSQTARSLVEEAGAIRGAQSGQAVE